MRSNAEILEVQTKHYEDCQFRPGRRRNEPLRPLRTSASYAPLRLLLGLLLVRMLVLMVVHRDHAAMRDFTHHILELDGRVVDMEAVQQALLHVAQDRFAF
jgi:hypothetical protein